MTCSVTGLTAFEKDVVVESWKILACHKKDNGIGLFIIMFEKHRDAMDHFYHFEGRNLNYLRDQANMRAHGASVMYTVNSFVDNLCDPPCLRALIRKIAETHKKRHVDKTRFEQLRGVFGIFLDEHLGREATDTIKTAWDKFLLFISNTIDEEQKLYDLIKWEDDPSNSEYFNRERK